MRKGQVFSLKYEVLEMKEASVMLSVQVQFMPSFYPPSIKLFLTLNWVKKREKAVKRRAKLQISWSHVEPRHRSAKEIEAEGNSNYVFVCEGIYTCGKQTGCRDLQHRSGEEFLSTFHSKQHAGIKLCNSVRRRARGKRERNKQEIEREREREHQTLCNNWL